MSAAGGADAAAALPPGGRGEGLSALSREYRASGDLLRARLRILRRACRESQDREEIWHLQRRIAVLAEMLRQVNELTELTAHYYERGYCRNGKYTL